MKKITAYFLTLVFYASILPWSVQSATFYNYNVHKLIFDNTYLTDGQFNDLITKGPWVDVRAYAPVGTLRDGTVDWTAYIQAAINSVTTGAHVLIPDGKYLVTSTITLSNGTKLRGQGRNFPGPASPHKGTQLIFTGTGPCIKGGGGGTAVYNVEISDIEIVASGAAITDNTAVGILLTAHDSFVTKNAIWNFKAGSGIEIYADGTFTSGNNISSNWVHSCNRSLYLHGTTGNTTSVVQYNFFNGGSATGTRTCIDAQQGANYNYYLFNDLETADRGMILNGAWNQVIGNTTEFLTAGTSIHITLGVNSLENKILSHNFISEVTTNISDLGTRNEYLGGRAAGGAGTYVGNKLIGGLKIDGSFLSQRGIDSFAANDNTPSIVGNNYFLTSNSSTDNLVITDFLGGEGSKVITIVGWTSSHTTTVKDNHGTGGNLYLNGDWVVADWNTLTLLYINTRWIEIGRTPAP